ncbi:MAG: peptidase, partial [Staphylococcus equorum]|nr:peptidase [Staphylococcus equorum]
MMEKHNHLAVMNFEKTICENLEGVDYISFKDEYNTNDNMSLSFIVYRMNSNRFEFDMLICENFIIFQGQTYVIKEATPKTEGSTVSVEITAHHIMFEFQNHYIESNRKDEEDGTEDAPIPTYTLEQYLEYGFKNQNIMHKYKYEIIGDFNEKVEIEELGGKNGIEYIKEGVELFNYIFYPKDDVI